MMARIPQHLLASSCGAGRLRLRWLLFCTAGAFLLSMLELSHAQSVLPPKVQAIHSHEEELYIQASEALERGDLSGAHTLFEKLWRIAPNFDTAAALGFIELEVGRVAQAAGHLRYALDVLPVTLRAERQETIQELLREARLQVAEIDWSVSPADATVWVDDKPMGSPLFLMPGKHIIRAEREGFKSQTVSIVTHALELQTLALKLDSTKPTPTTNRSPNRPTRPAQPPLADVTMAAPTLLLIGGGVSLAAMATALWLRQSAESDVKELPLVEPGYCLNAQGSALCRRRGALADSIVLKDRAAVGFTIASGAALAATLLTYWFWQDTPPLGLKASASQSGLAVSLGGIY